MVAIFEKNYQAESLGTIWKKSVHLSFLLQFKGKLVKDVL